ncbi:related to 6-hydroxy-D-nicotine oxidase [Rhynchosporium agropyri]|uniref:Related to 6-hydroxy-D-nicotine oxidase n=1 Tax=Rhynchosporium agropyri TaxID=914238 RepID=A0A1E1L1E1_9HELO|nr:related to 6-hydroxy-D-nicotine oxidase [Rhynchosporium agropyri]
MRLILPALLLAAVSAEAIEAIQIRTATLSPVCIQIAKSIKGKVYYNPGHSKTTTENPFTLAISHWMTSSTQTPLCVVEPDSAQDISVAIKIIGSTKTPFAVKSAGYGTNPGFSSTTGVHISLEKFKMVNVSQDKQTAEVGLGNTFTAVYQALNGTGVNVVGARADGPGAGGVTLSGGYSWYTNQYGLGCDTVVSYEVVLTDGRIVTASKTSEPDLFFALKGGLNRFGIVTKIVFKTVPQPGKIYGGIQFFSQEAVPALLKATQDFQLNSKDPKASVILTLGGGTLAGAILLSFYDGPNRPADFNVYNGINDTLSTVATQDYSAMIAASPTSLAAGNRGVFASLSTTTLTIKFMEAVVNETVYWSKFSEDHGGTLMQYDVEPFHPYGKYATDSAYPHANSPLPLNIYFAWTDTKDDAFWNASIQKSLAQLRTVAKAEGILTEESVYPGYAYGTTTWDSLYGKANAQRLRTIRQKYDPQGVMLLAGGFKS